MIHKSTGDLTETIRRTYENEIDGTDESTITQYNEARSVMEGVIDILRGNPDLSEAIEAAHPKAKGSNEN